MTIDAPPTRPTARPAAAAAPAPATRDRLGLWCGWVLVGAAALTPLLAFFSRMGFSPLLAVTGLLCLPAMRLRRADLPFFALLAGLVLWASVSSLWTPYHPRSFSTNTPAQIALTLPLGWSALCGARRADRRLARLATEVLTWGLALLGVLLVSEAVTGARVYQGVHVALYKPIRADFAQRDVGDTAFITALLWPLCLGAVRRWRDVILAVPAIAGTLAAAHAFGADAPVIAVPVTMLAALVVWRLPRLGPLLLAAAVGALWELMPVLLWLLRAGGHYADLARAAPISWAWRLNYWSRVIDWIAQRPFQGWGVDASRVLGEGTALHPHNGSLQVWLELGLPGALLVAAAWATMLLRLRRPAPSWAAAGQAGAACVFLLYANASYGVWQAWFYCLGVMVAVFATAASRAVEEEA